MLVEEYKEKLETDETLSANQSDALLKLLQANLEKSEEILKISQEIKKYIHWQKIWSTVRLILIIAPIILGFLYLPSLLKDYFSSFESLLQ